MTKKQEAIERLKRIDVKFFISGMNEVSNYIIDEADKVNNAIETVLNMLKEKDEKIAKYEKIYKEYDCYRWVKELEKKDKIIDLMAERIEWLCKSNGILLDKEHDENFTQQDIKQYFERKARNERD